MTHVSQRFFSADQELSGSGLLYNRPLVSYRPSPVATELFTSTERSNYPSNSYNFSRESKTIEKPDLGAFRYIETAGAKDYRAVRVAEINARQSQMPELPDIKLHQGANGLILPFSPKKQHPNYSTSNNQYGKEMPKERVTNQYRYHPRAHTWTNQYNAIMYRSMGLNTAKDPVPVHRVEFFSNP